MLFSVLGPAGPRRTAGRRTGGPPLAAISKVWETTGSRDGAALAARSADSWQETVIHAAMGSYPDEGCQHARVP